MSGRNASRPLGRGTSGGDSHSSLGRIPIPSRPHSCPPGSPPCPPKLTHVRWLFILTTYGRAADWPRNPVGESRPALVHRNRPPYRHLRSPQPDASSTRPKHHGHICRLRAKKRPSPRQRTGPKGVRPTAPIGDQAGCRTPSSAPRPLHPAWPRVSRRTATCTTRGLLSIGSPAVLQEKKRPGSAGRNTTGPWISRSRAGRSGLPNLIFDSVDTGVKASPTTGCG